MRPIRFFFLLIVKMTEIIIKSLYNMTDNYPQYIYVHDLTPSRITTQFYFSITLYIFSKLSNLRSCSQNNIIIYYQNHITICGFTNYFKNKVRKSLADTT